MLGDDACQQRGCWSTSPTIVTCSKTFDDGLFAPKLDQAVQVVQVKQVDCAWWVRVSILVRA